MTTSDFSLDIPISFGHCDPAGIVFYPRYFEMMNDCMEAFFADVVAWSFADIHDGAAIPTAEITTRFVAPSRLGDTLLLSLAIVRVGNSSCSFELKAVCEAERRFETALTIVHVGANGRPVAWPENIKTRLLNFKESQEPCH